MSRRAVTSAVRAGLTAATLALAAALLAAAAPLAFGLRPEIERSDSMRPAIAAGALVYARPIAAGALVYARPIAAGAARAGQILTFADPERPGRTLTHRVRSIRRSGEGRLAVVTRGDANTGAERWTIARDGRVARVAFSVPALGGALAWAQPRFAAIVAGLLALLAAPVALRLIWRAKPSRRERPEGFPVFFERAGSRP